MSKLTANIFISIILWSLSLILLPSVFAARSLVIESYKENFTNDEEGDVKVVLNDFTSGESIFVKGAFSFPDSTNYFGYTKKSDSWVKNSITSTDQLTVKAGEWDGKLTVKPDLSDTGFKGSGNYNFKVGFYYYTSSSSGDLSSVNWSDTKNINITFVPTPTPTPTSTPTPSQTPAPSRTPTPAPTSPPTSMPSSTPSKSPTPTITGKPVSTSKVAIVKVTQIPITPVSEKFIGGTIDGQVLGDANESSNSLEKVEEKQSPLPIFILFFGGGVMFIIAAAVIGLEQMKTEKKI